MNLHNRVLYAKNRCLRNVDKIERIGIENLSIDDYNWYVNDLDGLWLNNERETDLNKQKRVYMNMAARLDRMIDSLEFDGGILD